MPVLADILAFGARLPELPGLPQIACLDEKGRACVADAVGQLGWEPGDMRAWREGHWLVLEPAGTRGTTLKRRPAMSQVAGETLLSSIATMLAHSGFSAEDLARHMVTSATFPTVEEHVKQVLANAGSRNTRRTWKTHYDRLVMGTAGVRASAGRVAGRGGVLPSGSIIAMAKEKATITLDRRKAEEARALVGAESTSAVVDVALDRLIRLERLRRDIGAYRAAPPTDDEVALADLAGGALLDDDTDWAALYSEP